MSKLIMGIDGGGTKSHLALFDLQGKCVGVSVHGPLNHESMEDSFAQLEKELSTFILTALKRVGADVNDVAYGVFGLAGVDTRRQHSIISDILQRMGLVRFTLCNDAYLGVAAGCPRGVGICAINGTGSTMAAIDYSGKMMQVGGVGEVSNDCGGSGWYGSQLLGAVYGDLFKSEHPTVMTGMIFDKIGLPRKEEYIETVTARLENGILTTEDLNRLVFVAAGAGDAVAKGILNRSAEHYAGGIIFLTKELNFPENRTVHVTLAGSVFVKEQVKILPQLIEEKVRRKLSDHTVDFFSLDAAPVAGAVFWAFQNAGAETEMGIIREALTAANL